MDIKKLRFDCRKKRRDFFSQHPELDDWDFRSCWGCYECVHSSQIHDYYCRKCRIKTNKKVIAVISIITIILSTITIIYLY